MFARISNHSEFSQSSESSGQAELQECALDLQQVHIAYSKQGMAAVQSVSLQLDLGDIGVLIGPSGCGKTSLLRAIAGLQDIQRGSIAMQGRTISSAAQTIPPEERRIGMVFQDYALFPHLTVAENVGFGMTHLPRSARIARQEEVLTLVGLLEEQHRYPHALSGGQQQRVALARALAPGPALLLLDEPFSNLDIDLRERLAHDVRAILKAAKATALFVTHDQQEAFAMGDKIGVMHQGELHQWADAYTVYHRPASRFVAEFIGHGVFLPARIETIHGVAALNSPLGLLQDAHYPLALSPDGNNGCDVLLRADDISHDDHSPTQAKIIRKAFRGAEFLYTLELRSGHTVLAHVPSHHDHAVGEWIGIRAEVDHLVTFKQLSSSNRPYESPL